MDDILDAFRVMVSAFIIFVFGALLVRLGMEVLKWIF